MSIVELINQITNKITNLPNL